MLGFFFSVSLLIYYFFSTRNKERMALIENNMSAEIFRNAHSQYNALKYALTSIGIGLGLFVAYFITEALDVPEPLAYISFAFIFGGVGLLIFYLIVRFSGDKHD